MAVPNVPSILRLRNEFLSTQEDVVGVFCPNCGSKNESTATPCDSCGFRLAGVSAPKFKGTMMLSSDEAVKELLDAHKAKEAAALKPEDTSEPTAARRPLGGATMLGIAGIPRPKQLEHRRMMAGTMLGVAPQARAGVNAIPPIANESVPSALGSQIGSNTDSDVSDAPSVTNAPDTADNVSHDQNAATALPGIQSTQVSARSGFSAHSGELKDSTASIPVVSVTGPRGSHDRNADDGNHGDHDDENAIPISSLTEADGEPPSQTLASSNESADAPEPVSDGDADTAERTRKDATGDNSQDPIGSLAVDGRSEKGTSSARQPMTAGEVFLTFATCGLYALVRRLRS